MSGVLVEKGKGLSMFVLLYILILRIIERSAGVKLSTAQKL